jgi:hypothetical protein
VFEFYTRDKGNVGKTCTKTILTIAYNNEEDTRAELVSFLYHGEGPVQFLNQFQAAL